MSMTLVPMSVAAFVLVRFSVTVPRIAEPLATTKGTVDRVMVGESDGHSEPGADCFQDEIGGARREPGGRDVVGRDVVRSVGQTRVREACHAAGKSLGRKQGGEVKELDRAGWRAAGTVDCRGEGHRLAGACWVGARGKRGGRGRQASGAVVDEQVDRRSSGATTKSCFPSPLKSATAIPCPSPIPFLRKVLIGERAVPVSCEDIDGRVVGPEEDPVFRRR